MKGHNKVSLEPSLPQAEQPQFSQPFFKGEVFQSSDHFYGIMDHLKGNSHTLKTADTVWKEPPFFLAPFLPPPLSPWKK